MKKNNFKKLVVIILSTALIGSLFAAFTINSDRYQRLAKPFEIPAIIFPIVWSVLYILMGASFYIITQTPKHPKKKAYILYILQLFVNSLWTLFFFGFNLQLFSFFWLILLIVLVILMIISFYEINKTAAYFQIPYFIWLVFAAYLNLSIYLLNRT